ncbi:MAG TPA: 3-deoxy-7-phosphoheptulonate synthase, partial [Candidatus Macondimonas sp.]|nr:3-deoxy-7-phosphoheptulonate synthase [Candidatus Macondimonas sp.]
MSEELLNNINVVAQDLLITPRELKAEIPLSAAGERTVLEGRRSVRRILDRRDPRLLVVIGPCSVHDVEAARD